MKIHSIKAKIHGMSLIDLLVVIGVVVVLYVLLMQMGARGGKNLFMVRCMNNQKQTTIGFLVWQKDSCGAFPWQISMTNSGTMELSDQGIAPPNFNVLAPYIKTPQTFVCPSDQEKIIATNGVELSRQNISYFVGLDCNTNPAAVVVVGDRHLEADKKPVNPGLFVYSNEMKMGWTLKLHGNHRPASMGVVSFLDGHVQMVRGTNLDDVFQRQGSVTSRYVVP